MNKVLKDSLWVVFISLCFYVGLALLMTLLYSIGNSFNPLITLETECCGNKKPPCKVSVYESERFLLEKFNPKAIKRNGCPKAKE